jgi:hypothetical protein
MSLRAFAGRPRCAGNCDRPMPCTGPCFWRSLREHVVDRLDLKNVTTIDELNLRLWSYVESETWVEVCAKLEF